MNCSTNTEHLVVFSLPSGEALWGEFLPGNGKPLGFLLDLVPELRQQVGLATICLPLALPSEKEATVREGGTTRKFSRGLQTSSKSTVALLATGFSCSLVHSHLQPAMH